MALWFYVQELPKAQPAVVLVLKRLKRRGNSLKSHPTDWEKPGIEPATPGLQDIGLSPAPQRLHLHCSFKIKHSKRETTKRFFCNILYFKNNYKSGANNLLAPDAHYYNNVSRFTHF